jgi:hypothetical protein
MMSKTEQIVISSNAMLRKSRGQTYSRAKHRRPLNGMTDSAARRLFLQVIEKT